MVSSEVLFKVNNYVNIMQKILGKNIISLKMRTLKFKININMWILKHYYEICTNIWVKLSQWKRKYYQVKISTWKKVIWTFRLCWFLALEPMWMYFMFVFCSNKEKTMKTWYGYTIQVYSTTRKIKLGNMKENECS